MKLQIAALMLRAISAGSKLIFVLILGYWGEKELLGEFAIFATLVVFFSQIAGLEIHQTIGRLMHVLTDVDKKNALINQTYAVIFSYFILLLVIYFVYGELLKGYWFFGAFILIGEHVATEIYRHNIIMLRPQKASVVLFVKNFGWVAAFIFLAHYNVVSASIGSVLILWAFFILIAICLEYDRIFYFIKTVAVRPNGSVIKNSFLLIWSGRFFIISAIFVGLISAIDKIVLAGYFSYDVLGGYYFYQSLAVIPALIVGMTIGTTIWPKCIQLAAYKKIDEYLRLLNKIRIYYAITLVVLSLLILLAMPIGMSYMEKKYEKSDTELLFILLLSGFFFAMCEPYKLRMYIEKNDASLMIGNFIQFALVALSIILVLHSSSVLMLAQSILIANISALFLYWFDCPRKLSVSLGLRS